MCNSRLVRASRSGRATTCSSPTRETIDQNDMNVLLSLWGLDGTGAIRADFAYDAENRLIAWTPLAFVSGAKKCEFEYDYLGRRVEKRVYTYSSGWSLTATRRWVWQDWLPLLELDGSNNVIRKYTWGHDLATGGAGGIGGLLAIADPNDLSDPNDLHGDWTVFYDASGNVGQLVDWAHDPNDPNSSMDAKYEYDAYGNLLTSAGSYAAENPIRFSTKHWDSETGMGYWGYRYCDPRLGRWINRDPIGERGGKNLYGYVRNRPSLWVDHLGLLAIGPSASNGCPTSDIAMTTPCPDDDPPQPAPPIDIDAPIGPPPTGPVVDLLSIIPQFPPGYQAVFLPGGGWACMPNPPVHSKCPPGQHYDCDTGECVNSLGSIYGNCCGPFKDCSPTGCLGPVPGNCMDAVCDKHDDCLYDAGIVQLPPDFGEPSPFGPEWGACDCAAVCEAKACAASGGAEENVTYQLMKGTFCFIMNSNDYYCGCCHD